MLYTYLQGDFYNSLPDDLKSVIKPTRVISGYGCRVASYVCTNPDSNGNNFVTTDYLYLYSGVELVGEDPYDTAAATTHQMEYYVGKSNNDRIKKIQINSLSYWMRTAYSLDKANFRIISGSGELAGRGASSTSYGMVPVFRIG